MILTIQKKISYFYFRYLLVTELYMVEKWERVMIHTVFCIMLTMLSLFNWKVVLELTKTLYEPSSVGLIETVIDMAIIAGCMLGYHLFIYNKIKNR